MIVVGTFALFWKQTLKPFLYFHDFFSHKFELLDKFETGHCTHWNMGKVYSVCLFDFFFIYFFCNISARAFFPIHINCHNNTEDIKKKPPHLLSFCDCKKVPLRGRVPIMHLVRWFMLPFSSLVVENKLSCNSQLRQNYSKFPKLITNNSIIKTETGPLTVNVSKQRVCNRSVNKAWKTQAE